MYCRIRLKDTNYQEYHNYRILDSSSFNHCLAIYREYVTYKKFTDVVPIFLEEFELPHTDIIGYYDGNELAAFTLAYKFKSVNSCLLYTSPSPRDLRASRMPSSA